MMSCSDQLLRHEQLRRRQEEADARLAEVRDRLKDGEDVFRDKEVTIYVAGSLGRGDIGQLSDLDLFLITTRQDSDRKWLDDLEILAHVLKTNNCLRYDRFSNDGKYLKVYSLDKCLKVLGAPEDDIENLFTARMLLLLESRWVYNQGLYEDVVNQILKHYFRDSQSKDTFRPLFLLNDLLRYWRTLCLNYELTRNNPGRPWRKKNINLKFSRMLTVFGTVLPIITKQIYDIGTAHKFVKLSPHSRFALGLESLNDRTLNQKYSDFLDDYEKFLHSKEAMKDNQKIPETEGRNLDAAITRFSDFIYSALTHERAELKRYLVL